jgi:hypothetical protein
VHTFADCVRSAEGEKKGEKKHLTHGEKENPQKTGCRILNVGTKRKNVGREHGEIKKG